MIKVGNALRFLDKLAASTVKKSALDNELVVVEWKASGAVLLHRGRRSTTPAEQAEAKAVRVWFRKECRQEENRRFLKHRNVRAFVRALAVSLNPGLAPEGAAAGAGLPSGGNEGDVLTIISGYPQWAYPSY